MEPRLYSRDYLLVNSANFLYSVYTTIFIFLPAFLYKLGAREGEIGLLMATGVVAGVVLKPLLGFVVGRTGRLRFVVAGAILAALSTIPWFGVTSTGPHLFGLRLMQGVAYSLFTTGTYAWLAATMPVSRRSEALGIFGLSYFVPAAVGGWIGEAVIGTSGYTGLFAMSLCAAALSVIPIFFVREPERGESLSFTQASVFRDRSHLVPNTAGFQFGIAYGTLFAFLPVVLVKLDGPHLSVFVAAYAISVIAIRTLARRTVDRWPKGPATAGALLLLSAGNAAVTIVDGNGTLALVGILAGAGHGLLFPALSALILERTEAEAGGLAMAMFTASTDMGTVVGAAAFGFVAQAFGTGPMFISAACVTFLGTLLFVALDPSFRRKPASR